MLASLLPGLREVRAPLAAGFVWLVAFWFLLEPRWPDGATQGGVVGSANRLMHTLNLVGQGFVLSFAAYLVGSFSVFLFSGPLLSLIRTSREGIGVAQLSGLSELARVSLRQVAVDGRQRIEQALSLSGVGVEQLLGLTAPVPPSKVLAPRRRARTARQVVLSSDAAMPPTPEEEAEAEIASRVLRDLPVIANAQLLGQQTEMFSAVDRSQAEVEFRVALVPALAALALSVAAAVLPGQPLVAVAAIALGMLLAVGLMLDAARQRRGANELVLSLMEHGRITSPSVLRVESEAVARADQAPAKVVARQAEDTSRAIRQYLTSLAAVPSSGSWPMLTQAHDAARRAREEGTRLDQLLAQYEDLVTDEPVRTTAGVLVPLDQALSGWSTLNAGVSVPDPAVAPIEWHGPDGPPPEELTRLVREGRERFDGLVDRARTVVRRVADADATRAAVRATGSESG